MKGLGLGHRVQGFMWVGKAFVAKKVVWLCRGGVVGA